MADQLTEALSRVVGNPSFRRDAALFLSLPRSSVDKLAALVERHGTFDVPSSEVSRFEQGCNLKDQGRQVLTAARLIRSAVRRIDETEDRHRNLISFAALMDVDPFDSEGFSRFFSEPIVVLRSNAPTLARRAGFAKGTFTYIASDFDAPLEDFADYQLTENPSSQRDTAETYQPRLTGPVMFVIKLLQTWRLKRTDAIPLLGLEKSDSSYAEDLLSGRATLRGRDIKDRIAYLFRIRKTLFALFRDEDVENEWLREPHDALNGQTPMALLLEGSMDNILLVKEYVEAAAGR